MTQQTESIARERIRQTAQPGLYDLMGHYGETEPLYERSLAIDEQVYGKDHPDMATDLNNLALLYRAMGRYGEVEPLYLRAITIFTKALPESHPANARVADNFRYLVQAALKAGQADRLSDHLMTQEILRQLSGP